MTLTYRLSALTLASLAALGLSACEQPEERIPGDFISDDPTAGDDNSTFNGADEAGDTAAGEDGGEEGGDPSDDGGDAVEITEADIVQMEGDRLYALSPYSGLTVVDMTNPDALRALGTWETDAEPFEMYVEAGQVFMMFNDYGFWSWEEDTNQWSYDSSSRLVAIDASNPDDIVVEGEFSLPGRIQDSRRIGDVLYVVTMQDGYCWDCADEQQTVVTSLDVSDEAHPVIVDQIAFTAPDESWDWQRSVEASNERIYVASRTWAWDGMGSFIDVIDISAGDGTLVAGAQVEVTGGVFSRWQMNEHEGVLRVVSQQGQENPLIETFTIESSQSITPLGTGNLIMPIPESLRSVRFDGDRAYAITAEQTDPLFTIDLADPANPQQVGELEIPGWVYHMEARGDEVLALGFDPNNPDGAINVSLFDVSVFNAPALRRRVHFGGDWATFAEDQNRIHKAFSILDDEQMLLVPHEGWHNGEGDEFECSGGYRSGVQIIDWKDNDLTLRGLVPSHGRARRAFTHRERIVTLSDQQLATFEYADRDAPQARDDLQIAVQVDNLVRAGDVWVRMARDWWTSSQKLELVSIADPTSPEPLGVIELGTLDSCSWSSIEGVFAVDDHVFVVQSVQTWNENDDYSNSARVIAIDISNPSAPMIVDEFEVPGQRGWGVGQLANVSTQSNWLVQHGDHLAFLTVDDDEADPQVHVVDLSDPTNLALAASLDRPAGQTQGELSVMSDTIVSWHTEPVPNEPGKVRFYFDRLELGGDAPHWATKVNVPGIIVAYDAATGRAFTIDFAIHDVALQEEACWMHPKFWNYEWNQENEPGTCKLIDRTLEQIEVEGDHAFLIDSIDIESEGGLDQLLATNERIFARTDNSTWDLDTYEQFADTKLVIIDITSNEAARHEVDGEDLGYSWWITAVEGERAVIQQNYGEIGLLDASAVDQPEFQSSALPSWGGCYSPVIEGDTVYCPMGQYGLESVDW